MTDKDHERQNVLAQSVREIRRLRGELDAAERARTEPIAIVGLACRMPGGAETPEEFWEFLSSGRDGIRQVPEDRWTPPGTAAASAASSTGSTGSTPRSSGSPRARPPPWTRSSACCWRWAGRPWSTRASRRPA